MEGGWLLTGSARSSARVLTCSDSISARPAARPYSREPGPQAPVQEPRQSPIWAKGALVACAPIGALEGGFGLGLGL